MNEKSNKIKCLGNTCPDRHECALYTIEAEDSKTEPDEKPGKRCEFFKEKPASLWIRLGVSLEAPKEDLDRIISGDRDTLMKIIREGSLKIEGNSYIQWSVVEEYNLANGTNFAPDDICFELGEDDPDESL